MTFSPLGSYLPRRSALHRLPAGAKLLGMFALATLAIVFRSPAVAAGVLGIGLALALVAGLRGAGLWRAVRGFLIIGALLFAFTAVSDALGAMSARPAEHGVGPMPFPVPGPAEWAAGIRRGFAVVGTLFGLLLAASAFTASTPVDELLSMITRVLGPLRRFGVHPERVALAFSLVLTAIPAILRVAQQTREAARARGLGRSPRALLVPLVLRTVAHAQAVGEALTARGAGEDGEWDSLPL